MSTSQPVIVLVHGAWAGHLSLISEASVVTRVILEAVQATG